MSRTLGPGAPVLAFDVGGTDIKSTLVDAAGRVGAVSRTPTPRDDADPAGALAAALGDIAVRERAAGVEPACAGVLVPGIVDAERGVGVFSSNLGWRDAPVRRLAAEALGLPVRLHHDVTGAAWAEHRLGAARDFQDVVVIVIGTGIASGLILGGRPHLGGGYAGEIGHAPVADGPPCPCGASGCLERIASAEAVAARYRRRSGREVAGARQVLARVGAGDQDAIAVWDEALDALSFSLAQLTAILGPQAIVIGGGLSLAGDALFDPLAARLDARLSYHRRPLLRPAALGEDAGLLGAALLARGEGAPA